MRSAAGHLWPAQQLSVKQFINNSAGYVLSNLFSLTSHPPPLKGTQPVELLINSSTLNCSAGRSIVHTTLSEKLNLNAGSWSGFATCFFLA